jgi:hypothetical protein
MKQPSKLLAGYLRHMGWGGRKRFGLWLPPPLVHLFLAAFYYRGGQPKTDEPADKGQGEEHRARTYPLSYLRQCRIRQGAVVVWLWDQQGPDRADGSAA